VSEKLYKILAQKGETLNFSIALYNNETDPKTTKLAKRVARQFIEGFAKFCEEEGLVLKAGITDLPTIGSSGYVAVTKDDQHLMFLAVPHELIEIKETQ
jgi:hypothetical protein